MIGTAARSVAKAPPRVDSPSLLPSSLSPSECDPDHRTLYPSPVPVPDSKDRVQSDFRSLPTPLSLSLQPPHHSCLSNDDVMEAMALGSLDAAKPTLFPRLSKALDQWTRITTDHFVLSVIRHGFVLPVRQQSGQILLASKSRPLPPEALEELNAQVRLGALVPSKTTVVESPLFPVSKGPGKPPRLVWDGRRVNSLLTEPPWFPSESIREAMAMLRPDHWMVKVDIKSAFSHVPVHPSSRKLLGFRVEQVTYTHRCLPFGLAWSPFVWGRIIGAVITHLRKQGISILCYVDDMLIVHPDRQKLQQQLVQVLTLFRELDIVVSVDKSVLRPTRRMTFLGFDLDTEAWRVFLPEEKVCAALSLARRVLKELPSGRCAARRLANVTGTLVSFLPAIPSLRRRLLPLHRLLYVTLGKTGDYRKVIPPGSTFLPPVLRFLEYLVSGNLLRHREPIAVPFPRVALFSDASDLGWGALLLHQDGRWEHRSGRWSSDESLLHINEKEAIAWARGVELLIIPRAPRTVVAYVDSTVLLAHLWRTRASHKESVRAWVLPMLRELTRAGIRMEAAWLPTDQNSYADALSRSLPLPTGPPTLPPRVIDPQTASSLEIAVFLQRSRLTNKAMTRTPMATAPPLLRPAPPSVGSPTVPPDRTKIPTWVSAFWWPTLLREAIVAHLPPQLEARPMTEIVWLPWRDGPTVNRPRESVNKTSPCLTPPQGPARGTESEI